MINNENKTRIAANAAIVSIAVNTVLFVLKLTAGLVSSSVSMISDAVHSAADIASATAILFGIKLAGRPPTKTHPYGYGRYENIAALLLSILLFVTGVGIATSSVKNMGGDLTALEGGFFAPLVSIISIAVKESVFRYTYKKSKLLSSEVLLAEAWHHRADSLASIGSFCGVLGSKLGFPIIDPIAGIILSLFIIKTAISIFRESCRGLTDTAAPEKVTDAISETIENCGNFRIKNLLSRNIGSYIFIDASLLVNENITVKDADSAICVIRKTVFEQFPEVSQLNIYPVPLPSDTGKANSE